MTDTLYHIYLNDTCIAAALAEDEFKDEYASIKGFLELTNLGTGAKLDYVRCEPPTYADASY